MGDTSLTLQPFQEVEVMDAEFKHPNFIESNTSGITIEDLSNKTIIPTFADNSLTLSHQNFIQSVNKMAEQVYGELTPVECRVSHAVIGRIPSAQYKKASELREDEKTIFYQRLAFVSHVKGISRFINGQEVYLTVGGVRSYADDKLYGKPTPQTFRVFVGFSVRVCSNLCLTCDGYSGTFKSMTEFDIMQKSLDVFQNFEPRMEDNLHLLENLQNTRISEELFCMIIGRLRLYQFLSNKQRQEKALPNVIFGDQAVNGMVKGYVHNPNFGKREGEDITTWNLLQLANEASKQSYIDTWLDRNQNCTDFALGVQSAIEGKDTEGYQWFIE